MEKTAVQNEAQDVRKFFHGYAADFDSIYGHAKKRSAFDKIMDKLFRRSMLLRFNETLENSKNLSIQTILDVGCGSGVYDAEFLKQGKTVVGLDMAEGMIEIAKKRTAAYSGSGKISFVNDTMPASSFCKHPKPLKQSASPASILSFHSLQKLLSRFSASPIGKFFFAAI